ncbi:zinc-dependent peptidase [Sabulilitoribacter multivorans]|uniref:Zinc-dependent peptidase n=1 Tax=Flaviramulus multivorans TaxID=1304750 RepID=A0ABS9IK83_9FLAO|nr:zinc-dependent peptidase [Flaviramulus multivorans]MCF7560990.1 zinc-dependent peptidase [Flaviramulus multivorans]
MLVTLLFKEFNLASQLILAGFLVVMTIIILHYGFKLIEMGYVLRHKKPLYNHFYLRLKKLKNNQKSILENQFSFYRKLSAKEKKYFEHRLVLFIKDKDFIGREGIIITDEIKVLISATAVMLTFGFRDFYVGIISRIVVYPSKFYSNTNENYHKGEFNPKLRALVLSWEDFKEGFADGKDNLNLGIHEFTHAIHINSIKERDVSSIIFSDTFKEFSIMLSKNEALRSNISSSEYFREYAYTNQFEFLAVAIENFIETPRDFKLQFPQVYSKIKQMLNFNVAGY